MFWGLLEGLTEFAGIGALAVEGLASEAFGLGALADDLFASRAAQVTAQAEVAGIAEAKALIDSVASAIADFSELINGLISDLGSIGEGIQALLRVIGVIDNVADAVSNANNDARQRADELIALLLEEEE